MAKPTARVEKKTEEQVFDLDAVAKQFVARQDALNELMDVLQLLHERGILVAIKTALERYEEVAGIFADWVNRGRIQSPTKMLETASELGKLDLQGLAVLVRALTEAGKDMQSKPPTLDELLKSFEEEDVKRGFAFAINVLRRLGAASE